MRIREEFVFKHFMRNRRSFLSSYAVKGNIDVARDTISDREMTVAGCETACGQLHRKERSAQGMVSGHLTDEAIIELYFERSEEAIMSSMDKYGVLLRSLAWNILGNREDVEECVNDTYLAAWNSIPPERPEYLKAYLCKIARNNALDRVKEKTRSKRGGGKINLLLDELSECIASEADTVRLLENAEMAEVIRVSPLSNETA